LYTDREPNAKSDLKIRLILANSADVGQPGKGVCIPLRPSSSLLLAWARRSRAAGSPRTRN